MEIGRSIKKIDKQAFGNCKKLAKIHIKANCLQTVSSQAFKNVGKNIRVSVMAKSKTKYKKILKQLRKAGLSKAKISYKKYMK